MSRASREQRSAALTRALGVPVPERHRENAYEWREGYAHGLAGSSRVCPVSEQPWETKRPTRRDSWKHGRDAGRAQRQKEQGP